MGQKKTQYLRDYRSPVPTNDSISRIMSANRHKDTKPEIILRKALWSIGVKGYRLQWKKVPGSPDIAFPKKKVAIFINGCFWHRCPKCSLPLPKSNTSFWKEKFEKNKIRDRKKIAALEDIGWKTVTIWECEIRQNIETSINTIKTVISK